MEFLGPAAVTGRYGPGSRVSGESFLTPVVPAGHQPVSESWNAEFEHQLRQSAAQSVHRLRLGNLDFWVRQLRGAHGEAGKAAFSRPTVHHLVYLGPRPRQYGHDTQRIAELPNQGQHQLRARLLQRGMGYPA